MDQGTVDLWLHMMQSAVREIDLRLQAFINMHVEILVDFLRNNQPSVRRYMSFSSPDG